MARGGSKLLTGIISFILGFLFAILVEIGAVFGVYWFVMNNDINTVMATIGIPNTDDRYINTDKENGGVTTLKELLSGVKGLVFENGQLAIVGKSFDDISNLIPATQMLLDVFYGIADEYIEIDHEAFESNPLMNLAQVLSESVLNVKTAALLEKLGMDDVVGDGANPLVKALVAGAECDYATVKGTDLKLPVMYDYYNYNETDDTYSHCADNAGAFHSNLAGREDELLTPSGDNRYTLYYVPCRVTANGIEEAEYLSGEYAEDGKANKFQILEYGEDTDFIAVEYNNGNFEIDFDAVYAALNAESTDISDRFTGYSYYAPYARNYFYTEEVDGRLTLKTYSGKNYFRNSQNKMVQLDALTLSDIVADPFAPLDSVLVTEIIADGKITNEVFAGVSLGTLMRGDINFEELVEDLDVPVFMDVNGDQPIMTYLGYGVKNLERISGEAYSYTGKVSVDGEDKTCYISTANPDGTGKITAVWYLNGDKKVNVGGTKIKDVGALIGSITDDLTVGDILGLDGSESQLLNAIKDTTLSNMSNRMEELTVGEIISSEELEKSSMLRRLKTTKVSELSTAIDKLFIQTVYAEEVYGVDKNAEPTLADKNDYHADWLYYEKVGDEFVLANTQDEPPADDTAYDDALGHITEEEFEAGTYYTYGGATGMWRLVLYKNGVEKAYTMNNFNNMVASCADNVYNSKLYDLQKAKVIDKEKDLSKTFNGTELGNMTLEELINMVLDLPST